MVGFRVSRVLSTPSQEREVRWSETEPEDGQGASSSITVSIETEWSQQSDKILSTKWLANPSEQLANPL